MALDRRTFAPLHNVAIEDLVPADHFYRHLERTLDRAFVRDLARDYYARRGRPSIGLVGLFKPHQRHCPY
jgi:transposase